MPTQTLAQSLYRDSSFGEECELPRAGSSLENPYVYDESARELKALAARGMVEIVAERRRELANESLIDRLVFKRLR